MSVAAFMVLGAACGASEGGERAPFTVRDSAGVRLVTVRGDAGERGLPELRVADPPLVVIGRDEGAAELLHRVRGGLIMEDGGLAIANAGSHEVRFYDGGGRYLGAAGREGAGPGELRELSWMQAAGAEGLVVAVGDNALRRVTRFGADGALLGSVSLGPAPQPSDADPRALRAPGGVLGVSAEGGLIAFSEAVARLRGMAGPLPVRAALQLHTPGDAGVTELDSVTVLTWYETPSSDGAPFQPLLRRARLLLSANGDRFAYTEGLRHRIHLYRGGRLSAVVVEDRARQPFLPATPRAAGQPAADSLPAYDHLQVDSQGRVWAQAALEPGAPAAPWRVFGADGDPLGSLVLEPRDVVLDARGARALLLRRDSLDVERVELREIEGLTPPE